MLKAPDVLQLFVSWVTFRDPQELKDGWAEASAKLLVAAAMARGELGHTGTITSI